MSTIGTPKIQVNDDPFDKAVSKYERKAAVFQPPEPVTPPVSARERLLEERILRLEDQLQAAIDSLNAATIECAGSSVTLTLPDFPT